MTTQWMSKDAGPIQLKRVQKALSEIRWETKTYVELSGVIGGATHERVITTFSFTKDDGSDREVEAERLTALVGDRYSWTITKANAKEVIKDLEGVRIALAGNRPTKDTRIAKEQDEARNTAMTARSDQQHAANEAHKAMSEQIMSKAPAGAQALIVAVLKEDNSDIQSDYFNNRSIRTIAIGWRYSKREDFKALARAAKSFVDTQEITFTEHRDNYSMGKGNYLSDHGWDGNGSGWVIKSYPLPVSTRATITEDALPATSEAVSSIESDSFTVSPSSLGRAGVVEVRFGTKPPQETLDELRGAGFRWARGNRCWYGNASTLPDRYLKVEVDA